MGHFYYNAGGAMLGSFRKRKKWVWLGLASDEVWVSVCVVRMGYAANAFAFVHELRGGFLADTTVLGPPGAAHVADEPLDARFAFGTASCAIAKGRVTARLGGIELDATFGDAPRIEANARVGEGLYSFTEKRCLAPAEGRLRVGGRTFALDGARAGWDYTNGLMPRHTRWRWAFGIGHDRGGAPLGFNLTEGFVGAAECAAFTASGTHPLGELRITYAAEGGPWQIRGDGVDLAFEPGGVHAQRTNLLVVRSRFLQPAGLFTGTLRIGGERVAVERMPGVVEDQDVLW